MALAQDGLTSSPVGPPLSEFVFAQQDCRRNEDSVESPVAWLPLHLVAFEGPAQFAHHSSGEAASIKSSSLRESKRSVSHSRVLCSVAQQSTTFRAIDLAPGIIPLHHPFSTMGARRKAVTTVGFAIAPSPSADEWDSRPTSLRFPDLRHELTLQPASLRFTTNQSCVPAQASSTESALFFNGIIFRYTASGALTSPSTVSRAASGIPK